MQKKPPLNPLTDEHKHLFVENMKKWQKLLNLMDWRYVKNRKKSREMADVEIFPEDRLVRYAIGTDTGSLTVTDQLLDQLTCHESLHILLDPLIRAAAASGNIYEPRVMELEHGVIAVLEKLLTQPPE